MKKFSLIILLLIVPIGFGFNNKCGQKPVGTGGGGSGSDWEFVKSISSTWIVLPEKRPPLMSGPNSVKIYSDKPLSVAKIQNYTAGVQKTLDRTNWNNPRFTPIDWWQKDGKPFSRLEDYSIVVKPPDGQSQSAEHRGCGLLHVRIGYELVTAIGTNAGQLLINNIPRAPGGLYLVIAGEAENEPAQSNCDTLRRDGTAAEAEHARAMGAPAIWFEVLAIDFTTGHPYFNAPAEQIASGATRRADGTIARTDYAPASPDLKQIRSVNLTPEQMDDLEKRYGSNLASALRDETIQRQLAE